MTTTAMCRHNVDHYVSSCGQCDRDRSDYDKAETAYKELSHLINHGSTSVIGAVLGREHPYLLNELVSAVAVGVLRRTYDSICRESVTNGGRMTDMGIHPEHDGRLGCGAVVGAMRTLATNPLEDEASVLKSREFCLSRMYEPGY